MPFGIRLVVGLQSGREKGHFRADGFPFRFVLKFGRVFPSRLCIKDGFSICHLEILNRGEDGDVLKGVKGQWVGVTGENELGGTVNREFEKLIVTRVATGPDGLNDLDLDAEGGEQGGYGNFFTNLWKVRFSALSCQSAPIGWWWKIVKKRIVLSLDDK